MKQDFWKLSYFKNISFKKIRGRWLKTSSLYTWSLFWVQQRCRLYSITLTRKSSLECMSHPFKYCSAVFVYGDCSGSLTPLYTTPQMWLCGMYSYFAQERRTKKKGTLSSFLQRSLSAGRLKNSVDILNSSQQIIGFWWHVKWGNIRCYFNSCCYL